MHIQELRAQTPFEEVDYVFLMDRLKEYAQPRQKIRVWLQNKMLLRVKKGIYVFGQSSSRGPYCLEHLANIIYGPSIISLEYALSFYGWIPESVHEVTSVTTGRNKIFNTPVGRFNYRHQSRKYFPYGTTDILIKNRHVLMATPEKALLDLLYFSKPIISSQNEFNEHLFENLRINEEQFENSKLNLYELASIFRHPYIRWLKIR